MIILEKPFAIIYVICIYVETVYQNIAIRYVFADLSADLGKTTQVTVMSL